MSLSYTKRGPGRKPAHGVRARKMAAARLMDTLISGVVRAQKRKEQKKAGVHTMNIRGVVVDVFHDSVVSVRNGVVTLTTNLGDGVRFPEHRWVA